MANLIPYGIDPNGRFRKAEVGDALVDQGGTSIGGSGSGLRADVKRAAAQSIAINTWVPISFDTEVRDDDNMVNLGANSDRITITKNGDYLALAHVSWTANASGLRLIAVYRYDVSDVLQDSHTFYDTSVSTVVGGLQSEVIGLFLGAQATDYIQMHVYQTAASPLDLSTARLQLSEQAGGGAGVPSWQSYTPAGAWTNTTYAGDFMLTPTAQGFMMDLSVRMTLTGTPAGSGLTFPLPSGYQVDPSVEGSIGWVGDLSFDKNAVGSYTGRAYASGTTVSCRSQFAVGTGAASEVQLAVMTPTAPITFAAADTISVQMRIPVVVV